MLSICAKIPVTVNADLVKGWWSVEGAPAVRLSVSFIVLYTVELHEQGQNSVAQMLFAILSTLALTPIYF